MSERRPFPEEYQLMSAKERHEKLVRIFRQIPDDSGDDLSRFTRDLVDQMRKGVPGEELPDRGEVRDVLDKILNADMSYITRRIQSEHKQWIEARLEDLLSLAHITPTFRRVIIKSFANNYIVGRDDDNWEAAKQRKEVSYMVHIIYVDRWLAENAKNGGIFEPEEAKNLELYLFGLAVLEDKKSQEAIRIGKHSINFVDDLVPAWRNDLKLMFPATDIPL